jgi:Protein of unknown function (DUF1460)
MKHIILFIAFSIISITNYGQFNKKIIEEKLNLPVKEKIAETALQIGESFLGLPYEGGTLEGPEEKLVCKLDAFDCYTFVENVLAISLTKHSKTKSFESYIDNLQKLRYRKGTIDGYGSRIHYFTEWVKLAEQRKIVSDITPALGVKTNRVINFMSKNRKLYPSLSSNEKAFNDILYMEKSLSKYQMYHIPKADFKSYESAIKSGDIVVFTSTVAGLDVNHEGFAYRKNGKLYLMHASIDKKQVIISEETMGEYLMRIKKHAGVMVVRIN